MLHLVVGTLGEVGEWLLEWVWLRDWGLMAELLLVCWEMVDDLNCLDWWFHLFHAHTELGNFVIRWLQKFGEFTVKWAIFLIKWLN